eukprot:12395185-Prorocentrum_lima.AAC.1
MPTEGVVRSAERHWAYEDPSSWQMYLNQCTVSSLSCPHPESNWYKLPLPVRGCVQQQYHQHTL